MRRHSTSAILAALATACAQGAVPNREGSAPKAPSHRQARVEGDGAQVPDRSSDLILRDARLIRIVDGKTVAQVSAEELRYQRQGGEFHAAFVHARLLPGPQARALDSFGAVEVKAPELDGDRSQTRAIGPVSVSAARGDRASGSDVLWDGERRLLSSERPVSIAGNGYTLTGGSLEATTDGERFELGHGAGGTVSHAPGISGDAR